MLDMLEEQQGQYGNVQMKQGLEGQDEYFGFSSRVMGCHWKDLRRECIDQIQILKTPGCLLVENGTFIGMEARVWLH